MKCKYCRREVFVLDTPLRTEIVCEDCQTLEEEREENLQEGLCPWCRGSCETIEGTECPWCGGLGVNNR